MEIPTQEDSCKNIVSPLIYSFKSVCWFSVVLWIRKMLDLEIFST